MKRRMRHADVFDLARVRTRERKVVWGTIVTASTASLRASLHRTLPVRGLQSVLRRRIYAMLLTRHHAYLRRVR